MLRKYSLFILSFCLFVSCVNFLSAQDTLTVQTFTFSDISKRRDKFLFPDSSNNYRKILMEYTLKCDPLTSWDQYNCGEWDYLTYNMVYDHRGLLDSTYQSNFNFSVGGSTPDSFGIRWNPVYDYYTSWQYSRSNSGQIAFDSAGLGAGISPLSHPITTSELAGRSQYVWKASEIIGAGLAAGNLTALRLNFNTNGSIIRKFTIKMRNSSLDSLTPLQYEDSLNTVFLKDTLISGIGWKTFVFTSPFYWDGVSNIVVEFSFDKDVTGANSLVTGDPTLWSSGITVAGTDFYIDYPGSGSFVNLWADAMMDTNRSRTYEAWGYARTFNNGGLFQAGITGATARDFSLRTTGTDDIWRVQGWGAPDFDSTMTGSKNTWHHYAVTYDGTTMKLYYDGQLEASKLASLNTGNHDIWIGQWAGSWFNGKIDAFRAWNTDLSVSTLNTWRGKEVTASHPNFANLKGDYRFNEGIASLTADNSSNLNTDGELLGSAWWRRHKGSEMFRNFSATFSRPQIVFEQGTYAVTTLDSNLVRDSLVRAPVQVVFYSNPANGMQIPDNAPNYPSTPSDTMTVWQAATWSYTYNAAGVRTDSTWIVADSMLYKQLRTWYSPTVAYEIGRYITPYGIGLDLGPNGFKWMYDVTDYAPLLMDSVDFSAGNTQELINVKFLLIKGTPPAEVIKVDQIWDKGAPSYSYANMDNDVSLPAKIIVVDPAASNLRVKTRLTGHGHNSNTGSYPHCCEWKNNTHYLYANGILAKSWSIWQQNDCADNPVFPQGGTWLGSREGWCPGDVVKETEIDVSSFLAFGQITLDYDITPVPLSNLGMGGGNYVAQFHMVESKQTNFTTDGEIYDVIAPNDWDYGSRKNPICYNPKIVIRNSGANLLTDLTIKYNVSGGPQETYTWSGALKFMEKKEITLPVSGSGFWNGDANHIFTAICSQPNATNDLYPKNDTIRSHFNMPDVYNDNFHIYLRTNNRPNENSWTIRDINNNIVRWANGFAANTTYRDTLALPVGCYTFEFLDTQNDGLSYWANTAQGSGILSFKNNQTGTTIKQFETEFGRRIYYAFSIGNFTSVEDEVQTRDINIFPNPNRGEFTLNADGFSGGWNINIINSIGQSVYSEKIHSGGTFEKKITLNIPAGVYILNMDQGENRVQKRIMVE